MAKSTNVYILEMYPKLQFFGSERHSINNLIFIELFSKLTPLPNPHITTLKRILSKWPNSGPAPTRHTCRHEPQMSCDRYALLRKKRRILDRVNLKRVSVPSLQRPYAILLSLVRLVAAAVYNLKREDISCRIKFS